jgi:glutamate racemase
MHDGNTLTHLHRPGAVFDAGIGSYAAVALIQRVLPQQDIVYFADRASFPYGGKTRPDLLGILRRTLNFLDGFEPAAVLVASNAPSVTVLDELIDTLTVPIFGVRPPIRQALDAARGRDVAVLGVASLVASPEMNAYASEQAGSDHAHVHLVDASGLVELVESGTFLFDPAKTQAEVDATIAALDQRHPNVGAFTLSSTHLPWLRGFLTKACRTRPLLDPLDDAVAQITPHAVRGTGAVLCLITEDERYNAADFRRMLGKLGVSLPLHVVKL